MLTSSYCTHTACHVILLHVRTHWWILNTLVYYFASKMYQSSELWPHSCMQIIFFIHLSAPPHHSLCTRSAEIQEKSHYFTLSVLLHHWLRAWDKRGEAERGGGGAKSSIIYRWNLIRGRSLDGQRVHWQIFAASSHHTSEKQLKYENIVYCVLGFVRTMCFYLMHIFNRDYRI